MYIKNYFEILVVDIYNVKGRDFSIDFKFNTNILNLIKQTNSSINFIETEENKLQYNKIMKYVLYICSLILLCVNFQLYNKYHNIVVEALYSITNLYYLFMNNYIINNFIVDIYEHDKSKYVKLKNVIYINYSLSNNFNAININNNIDCCSKSISKLTE